MKGFGKKILGWLKLEFSVDYDRVKCQERVGENGTEIWLTIWILCAKWWKRKNGKFVLSGEHGHVYTGTGRAYTMFSLARPCVCWHGPCVLSGFRFLRFSCFFTYFCFELAFDVNIKVLDKFVRFLMALVWLKNIVYFELWWKHSKWVLEKH